VVSGSQSVPSISEISRRQQDEEEDFISSITSYANVNGPIITFLSEKKKDSSTQTVLQKKDSSTQITLQKKDVIIQTLPQFQPKKDANTQTTLTDGTLPVPITFVPLSNANSIVKNSQLSTITRTHEQQLRAQLQQMGTSQEEANLLVATLQRSLISLSRTPPCMNR